MSFTSIDFFILTAIVFVLYYLPGAKRLQLPLLVIGSLAFYGWSQPSLLLLLGISIAVNAAIAWIIYRSKERLPRLSWMVAGIIFNVLLLSGYKLAAPLGNIMWKLHLTSDRHLLGALATLQVPVGLSFYTFEGISLLVDSLSESQVSTNETFTSFAQRVCLFFSFFPHLMAGPIMRPKQFFPQIGAKQFKTIDWHKAIKCLTLGYFLKCFVADNLAAQTHDIFSRPDMFNTWQIIVGVYANLIHIFGDFAGYSLIAIGLGALFGYQLPENFNFPLRSQSFNEFWRRWHITLSTWLRDYVYIPLGGSKHGKVRKFLNLCLVMTICGFWHGTKLNYVVWGLLYAVFLAAESMLDWGIPRSNNPLIVTLRVMTTFSCVALISVLIVCPCQNVPLLVVSALHNFGVFGESHQQVMFYLLLFMFPVFLFHLLDLMRERTSPILVSLPLFPHQRAIFADALVAVLLFLTILNFGDATSFIYFQF